MRLIGSASGISRDQQHPMFTLAASGNFAFS